MEVTAPMAVTEASQVAAARRAARDLAGRLRFDETAAERVALVVTEVATNLVKHAKDGQVVLSGHGEPGARVDVLAIDRGPGMANVRQCFEDGYSTAGSPGTGLGAVARLSTRWDVYSQPGHGTVLAASVDRGPGGPAGTLEIGAVSAARPGETVCGDAWAGEPHAGGAAVMVVDGLGHGPAAAEAATAAVESFRHNRARSPEAQLEAMHAALRPTRGAAAAVAQVDVEGALVVFSGVGNIAAILHAPGGAVRHLVSHNGILGHSARRIAAYSYPWPRGGILIVHSDGLATVRGLDAHPGLGERTAGVIAGVLFRDLVRGRDDATVVVARERRR